MALNTLAWVLTCKTMLEETINCSEIFFWHFWVLWTSKSKQVKANTVDYDKGSKFHVVPMFGMHLYSGVPSIDAQPTAQAIVTKLTSDVLHYHNSDGYRTGSLVVKGISWFGGMNQKNCLFMASLWCMVRDANALGNGYFFGLFVLHLPSFLLSLST